MENRIIEPSPVYTTRLVKSEDLNHHGTLFAGRTAEWFVEAGFIAVASILPPNNIVCLKIHGLYFTKPANPGEIVRFIAKIVNTGKSSIHTYIEVYKMNDTAPIVSGFITFVHVDENTKACPHGITIKPTNEEEQALFDQAQQLKK